MIAEGRELSIGTVSCLEQRGNLQLPAFPRRCDMDDMDLEAKQISYWRFAADMLGPKYLLLLTVSTIVAVWLVVRATNRARANTSASLLGLTILLPFGVGIYSLLDGCM
ncbi:MAG: hypothetical protein ACK53L_17855, partial [Pirellulaceae bacterium]